MRSLTQAATLFSALASASVLSPSPPTNLDSAAKDITAVAGTTGSDHLTIHFRTPCQGCFVDADNGLDVILEIDAAEEECTSTPLRLNGLPLLASGGNDVASGRISFKSKSPNGLGETEVHAVWESTCLKGEASLVSVRFEEIDGETRVKETSGFTTSFKQKGQPTVLRLQDRPVDHISQGLCDGWLLPADQRLSLTPLTTESDASIDELLQVEYEKLEKLKLEMDELHQQMHETGFRIMSLLKQEFKACSGMKCIWDTAISKAPEIGKLLVSGFSFRGHRSDGCKDGDAQSPCSLSNLSDTSGDATILSSPLPTEAVEEEHVEEDPVEEDPVEEDPVEEDPVEAFVISPNVTDSLSPTTAIPSPATETTGVEATSDDANSPAPSFWNDNPPFGSPHGPNPSEIPGRYHGRPAIASFRAEWRRGLELRLGVSIVLMVLFVLLAAIVVHKIRRYRDPRRRAERAARREERRTRRLYRKAACKHKWRTWWKRYSFTRSSDYEEKREMILAQEGTLEDVMQQEITTLRNASDLVRNLVLAEEGRSRTEHAGRHSGFPSRYAPAELGAGEGSSRISDIAPSYLAPPPRYEEELEGDLTVVEGFRYTPSNTDDTPESSIVDCSPRLSFDSGGSIT